MTTSTTLFPLHPKELAFQVAVLMPVSAISMKSLALLFLVTLTTGCIGHPPRHAQPDGSDWIPPEHRKADNGTADDCMPSCPAGSEKALNGNANESAGSVVYHKHGHLLVAGVSATNSDSIDFNTTRNVEAIVIDLAWNDTMQDLDPFLSSPAKSCPVPLPVCSHFVTIHGGGLGAGDSPSRMVVKGDILREAMEACKTVCQWQATAAAHDPAVNLDWNLTVSVFNAKPS